MRNHLSQVNVVKLAQWCTANAEELQKLRLTKEEAAEKATAALGFPVTMSNLNSPCRSLGIQWRGSRVEKAAPRPTLSDESVRILKQAAVSIAEIRDQITAFEGDLDLVLSEIRGSTQPALFEKAP